MMSRLNQILLIILIIQVALGLYLFWPQSTTAGPGRSLLVDFSADDVVGLTISDGDNQLVLAKEGTGWVLPDKGDFPVNGETVMALLDKVQNVETGRLVTQTEGSHGRLQVAADTFNIRLDIARQDGSQDTLFLGSSAGAGANHVRANTQAEVYLTGEIAAFDANPQPATWIETLHFTTPQSTTVAITLENENGTFEFEKAGENWIMQDLADGETLDPNAITTLLNQSHSIRMTEPVGLISEVGDLSEEEIRTTVLIQSDDQTIHRLQVGPQDSADNSYLFKTSTSPYYIRVSQFTGDNLVNKTREDFLQVPDAENGAIDLDE